MPKLTREHFTTDTSGLLDDFDGVITGGYFGVKKEYADKVAGTEPPVMHLLVIETAELEKPIEQGYSVGSAKGWQVADGGSRVVSAKNPDLHVFHYLSRAGMLFDRICTLVGEGDKVKGQDFFIGRGHMMTDGDIYMGLNFHWKRESMKTVEEGKTSDVLLPAVYLGEAKGGSVAGVTTVEEDAALDAIVVEIATGKTERELKIVAMKHKVLGEKDKHIAYMRTLVSGPKLADLERDGKLTKGPDGKYI